jgi:chromosome segregation ATPase
MITLDQIRQLDQKVRKAIDNINSLKNENKMLQEKLDTYQLRIEELEILIDTFKEDQGEIENGIIEALIQLDVLEDNIASPDENSEQTENSIDEESTEITQDSDTSAELDEDSGTKIEPDTDNPEDNETPSTEVELDIF